MSIKNKKTRTTNAYRLKKIEEYLIIEGYVCVSYIKGKEGIMHWVDCISGGYDISYDPSTQPSQSRWRPLHTDFFYIHVEHGASGSADTVKNAVQKSRIGLKASGYPLWISYSA